ncbi:13626_t:CDS:2 [Racocetra fulgida]|uniref:13626_t:CDS:1 n=1 Tax=Racocetra fulgida TaxID=60492 RepID=A0A9N9FRJ1_9GLOM|nr:13626_t:CDS:2 [Racocetra fulgida]
MHSCNQEDGKWRKHTGESVCAQNIKIGHLAKSETDKVTVHDIGNRSFYVDTPGFDDSDEDMSDSETKPTASLKHEAKFIESFADDYNGNVQLLSQEETKIEDGPREAAKEVAIKKYEVSLNDPLAKASDFAILLFESLPKEDNIYKFTLEKIIHIHPNNTHDYHSYHLGSRTKNVHLGKPHNSELDHKLSLDGCKNVYTYCQKENDDNVVASERCRSISNLCKHKVGESPFSTICKEYGQGSNTEVPQNVLCHAEVISNLDSFYAKEFS